MESSGIATGPDLKALDGFDPVDALRHVNVTPRIVQDFRPLWQSLEWQLSDLHWMETGTGSFVRNEVPYTVNNSGALSSNAAALLLVSCEEAPPAGRFLVLEIGAGTGLFARSLLDEFRRLCELRGRDFYDRIVYHVTDGSPRTVAQWEHMRQFAEFGDRVVTGVCDAANPALIQCGNGETVPVVHVRAVFANYVLDSLPASVVRKGDAGPEELYVRTHITADSARMQHYTNLDIAGVRALAESPEIADRLLLAPLVTLLEYESDYRRADPAPPYLDEALAFGHDLDRVVLNHGALRCLETCRGLLEPLGFICFSDYGPLGHDEVAAQSVAQRFGPSIAIGVNFPLIEHHFAMAGCTMVKPEDDSLLPVHPRLLMNAALPRTKHAFLQAYSGAAYRAVEDHVERARQHIETGRLEQAKDAYQAALARSPRDWRMLGEAAEFLIRHVADYATGERLARAAVALNPWYAPWLWNTLGDALFCLDRSDEAHQCYITARGMDAADVRTSLNLSYTYARSGDYREALEAVAAGLAHDRNGQFRDRLLEKQQQILQLAQAKWTSEDVWAARRAARLQR
jgi:tetratricopeptide (TPR) repeat protein